MKLDFIESPTVEFKREYVSEINKTIIAFANTQGGTLYIGVADDATIVGVHDADKTCVKVTNSIRGSIKPDLIMLANISIEKYDDKDVVKVDVQRGTAIPYFLKSEGLKPQGVFLRHGTSSVPMAEEAFLRLIRSSGSQESYENLPSLNQNLTFEYARNEFKKQEITLEDPQMKSLGMMMENGTYTNLGLFISDQCPFEITVAAFQGTVREFIRDRVDFSGSLLKVQDEVFQMLLRYNKTASIFPGKERVDIRDYPDTAMREILLNCICHRLYEKNYNTQITIFDDRIEFISPGGLVDNQAEEEVMSGRSILRNPKLAHIFLRLRLSEALGIGIPRTFRSYSGYEVQPKVEFHASSCLVVLPNINEARLKSINGVVQRVPDHPVATIRLFSREEKVILDLFETNEYINRKNVEEALTVSKAMAIRYLKALVAAGVIVSTGGARSIKYYLASKGTSQKTENIAR